MIIVANYSTCNVLYIVTMYNWIYKAKTSEPQHKL